jgi:hypothetical protein
MTTSTVSRLLTFVTIDNSIFFLSRFPYEPIFAPDNLTNVETNRPIRDR